LYFKLLFPTTCQVFLSQHTLNSYIRNIVIIISILRTNWPIRRSNQKFSEIFSWLNTK